MVFQRSTIHTIDAQMKNVSLFPISRISVYVFRCVLKTKFKNFCLLLTETTNPLMFIFLNANLIIIHSYLTFSLVYFNVIVPLFILNLIHTLTYYLYGLIYQADRKKIQRCSQPHQYLIFTYCWLFVLHLKINSKLFSILFVLAVTMVPALH